MTKLYYLRVYLMSQRFFSLFSTQIQLAHHYWKQVLLPGDHVLDLTCGNGHDTLFLANIVLSNAKGSIHAYDIQEEAIIQTKKRLVEAFDSKKMQEVYFQQKCHSALPSKNDLPPIKLIVYNLGYLPGGSKACTTQTSSTIKSLESALGLLSPGGVISIMCYPGHAEGKLEESAIVDWVKDLNAREWHCCHHCQVNGNKAPSLLLIQKATFSKNLKSQIDDLLS